jgi:tetratricopeptide (TPR) repeat protein
MKRIFLTIILLVFVVSFHLLAQNKPDNSKIDMMLIRGDFKRVIDTCKQILVVDTLNSEVYYKLGLAYQNLLSDDKSFDCFLQAATISPDNNNYNFTLAKNYYTKGKNSQAKPILLKLCASDSMNWAYAYYLTSIYMQEQKYDESIIIYDWFYKQDSTNYVFMDKIGFACLRKGDSDRAIDMFNSSLALNPKNLNAIKNVAYLYAVTNRIDTAIQLLTRGIEIDPADMDLYARRAALNYSINYNKRALNDYLKILSSGDSSFLYLKRAGIGYTNNFQRKEAMVYLLKAYKKDTADSEVLNFLARNYRDLNDLRNSALYYNKIINILTPAIYQLGLNFILLAEVLKSGNQYNDAISAYTKSQEYRSDISIYINIANLYDEKLKNTPKAIYYYELFLDKVKTSQMNYTKVYIQAIKERVEYLKNPKKLQLKVLPEK